MPIETFPIGPLETNCHIVISGSDAVAVDPGGDLNSGLGEVLALLKEQNLTLRAILCTHFHFDHLYGVAALHEATGAPVYGPAGDASLLGTELGGSGAWGFPPVTTFKWEDLKEGPHTFGSIKCEVLTTPGHTPGSLSIYFPELNSIMTGDLLFYHSVGRTDFPGSSQEALRKSLHKKIFILPQETAVYPGHGPNTNVGEELANFYNLFDSITTLTHAVDTLTANCILGITANEKRCRELLDASVGITTALCPYIGYKKAASLAKESLKTDIPVKTLVLKYGLLKESELDSILDPYAMTEARTRQTQAKAV